MANINFGLNILPKENNTYTLGNSDYKWNIFANQINGTNVSSFLTSHNDIQINGTSIVNNGVANIPIADTSNLGVVKIGNNTSGVTINNGELRTSPAATSNIKAGVASLMPIVPAHQHEAIYYGLSKLAGVDLASGSDTVGVYSATAKTAIQTMLGIENAVTFTKEISGTVVSITGEPNYKYICGEVSSISIIPPSFGTIDVWFTSGSTATVLTTTGIIFPEWFDSENLDSDTVYEILITDGYGGVAKWETPATI